MQRDSSNFDVDEIAAVLAKFQVDYVLIGGVAAIYQGSDLLTHDFDVVPDKADDNLARLTRALLDLNAEVSFVGKLPRFPDGDWLKSAMTWTFETRLGSFDVLFAPAGAREYSELLASSTITLLDDGTEVRVASLDDLIAMKEAAGRTKDLLALPILRYLKERQENPPPSA